MRRDTWHLESPELGQSGSVIAYGHWGRPVLFYPSEAGRAGDLEDRGIIHALEPAIEAGRIKVYAVDTADGASWSNASLPIEQRAQNHDRWFAWITDRVVPAIHADCSGSEPLVTAGVSMGALHARTAGLRRADLFNRVVAMSGNYDPSSWQPWGEQGMTLYFNNPHAYVPNLHGEHLEWLRGHLFVQLVVGSGAWEVESTDALPSTQQMAEALWERGIPCALDVWGTDTPHDWPSWERMAAKHLANL